MKRVLTLAGLVLAGGCTTPTTPTNDARASPDAAATDAGGRADVGPSDGGLLQFGDLHYLGAFRVPANSGLEFGRSPALGFNPGTGGGGSLFIGCNAQTTNIAEISIPDPVNAPSVDGLNRARLLQGCANPSAGRTVSIPNTNGLVLGGILVHDGQLITSMYAYYDAHYGPIPAFFVKPNTDLSAANARGAFMTQNEGGSDSTDGWMAPIPSAWQAALHGTVASGNCCTAIITRSSFGPAAFAWNPADFANTANPIPTTALFYYDEGHRTLGDWDQTFDGTTVQWNSGASTSAAGVIPDVGRSILFFNSQGLGEWCYGCGTDQNPLPSGTCANDGSTPFCYDPAEREGKGPHAYPYRYQILAYDLNDLAAVAAGSRAPHSLRPYAIWPLTEGLVNVDGRSNHWAGGATYDPARRRIYFAASDADGALPIVHTWRVGE